MIAITVLAAVYFAGAALLLHWSFRSHGWDLGIFDQLLWNTAHGRPFQYSFREYLYLGDHFAPALLLLAPVGLLDVGPAPLLVIQGLAFGGAIMPLFMATRRLAGVSCALLVVGAYIMGLAQARAVTYDFHLECFLPLLAFTALWALTVDRDRVFTGACVGLLLLKEDAAVIVLGLCLVAWLAFGQRRAAAAAAGGAIAYGLIATMIMMPAFRGSDSNPIQERYGYLGDDGLEITLTALTRPDLLIDHLDRWSALEASLLVMTGVGFLPVLAPRLLPGLSALLLIPLLSEHGAQADLSLHYMVAPATLAMVLAVVALGLPMWTRLPPFAGRGAVRTGGAAVMLGCAGAVFILKSPLPPSLEAHVSDFAVGNHSRLAETFVSMVPERVPASAQATYVPHLTHREDIYEFPRVGNAEWVLLDEQREVPGYDLPGFDACVDELPSLGFEVVRKEDGISLWRRTSSATPPASCD